MILEMEMVDAVALLDHHGKTSEEFSLDKRIDSQGHLKLPSCSSSSRVIYDVLPNSKKVHEHSTSPEELNRTLHEIFSDIHTPDLVLNLPIVHSTIIIDVKKKIPPPVMKKSEKTMQLIQRLGLVSLSASSKVTEV